MKYDKLIQRSLVCVAGVGLLAACSTPPEPNAALTQAKTAVATASNDPMVRTSAPDKLNDAEEALNIAQQDWTNKEDSAKVSHNAYLAQRYAETAIETAKFRSATQAAANTARVVTLPEVLFKVGKADLNDQGNQAISDLVSFLRVRQDRTVTIDGYTDSTGSNKLNAALSNARAEKVKETLVAQGIDASRIQAKGLGPSNPVASNKTAAGRQQNRRVEVTISQGGMSQGASTGTGAPASTTPMSTN